MTSIFTVAYDLDAEWLYYLLATCKKFATGFQEHVVAYDPTHASVTDVIRQFEATYNVRPVHISERRPGHAHQMALKLSADRFIHPQADTVLYLDCDNHFDAPVTPAAFFVSGKPRLIFQQWDVVERLHHVIPWREGTSNLLGWRVDFETMRAPGAIFLRQTIQATREHVEKRYAGVGDIHAIMASDHAWNHTAPQWFPRQPTDGKPRASEFNMLGNFALRYHHDGYYLNDLSREGAGSPVRQCWSHWGVRPEDRIRLEAILKS